MKTLEFAKEITSFYQGIVIIEDMAMAAKIASATEVSNILCGTEKEMEIKKSQHEESCTYNIQKSEAVLS